MPSRSHRRPGRPVGSQTGEGREALLQAARELLAERGMPRVTLREVAERAGVQPALVNYYFGGKAGLLRAVVDEVASGVRARVRDAVVQEVAKTCASRSASKGVGMGAYAPDNDSLFTVALLLWIFDSTEKN